MPLTFVCDVITCNTTSKPLHALSNQHKQISRKNQRKYLQSQSYTTALFATNSTFFLFAEMSINIKVTWNNRMKWNSIESVYFLLSCYHHIQCSCPPRRFSFSPSRLVNAGGGKKSGLKLFMFYGYGIRLMYVYALYLHI